MEAPKAENPFYLVFIAVILLGLLSFVSNPFKIAGYETKNVNLLADVLINPEPSETLLSTHVDPKIVVEPTKSVFAVASQSQQATALTDSSTYKASPKVENTGTLTKFFMSLDETSQTGQLTRIAYFGDSMIEGDLISGDLRQKLQTEFGGEGVGFVPITSITAAFRNTIYHSFSDNWKEYNLTSKNIPTAQTLGISGHVFLAKSAKPEIADTAGNINISTGSWVQYGASNKYKSLNSFSKIRLFYGPGDGSDNVNMALDGRMSNHKLTGSEIINEYVLAENSHSKKLRLTFNVEANRNLYGLSLEGESGIILDNFSFRGNSGMPLTRIKKTTYESFNKLQDYRLIILHYGVNVASAQMTNYSFYEKGMSVVVSKLKEAFPNASILIIGMSDKGYNNAGEFTSDPSVPLLLKAQQKVATRNDVAFWNLYEAMGGHNSMVSWVESKPTLANKDYTHFNANGSRKVADLLYSYLLREYKKYKGQHQSI